MPGLCTGPGGTGPQYSFAELEGLWINAGGSRTTAPIAAAIALAESGGCSVAQNPVDNNGTQTSWGIWQISDGTHNMPVPDIYSPAVNAQQAIEKYKGAGNTFDDWGTYTSGAYKAEIGAGSPDLNVPKPGNAPPSQAGTGPADQSTCVLNVIPGVTGLWGGWCPLSKIDARVGLAVTILVGAAFVGLEGARIWASREGLGSGPAGSAARTAITVAAPETAIIRKPVQAVTRGGRSPVGRAPGEPFRYATPRSEPA